MDREFNLPRASAMDVVFAADNKSFPRTLAGEALPDQKMRVDLLSNLPPLRPGVGAGTAAGPLTIAAAAL